MCYSHDFDSFAYGPRMPDLKPEENDRIRGTLEPMIGKGKRFPSLAALARELDIKQPSLHKSMKQGGGFGHDTAESIASLLHITKDELLGRRPGPAATIVEYDAQRPNLSAAVRSAPTALGHLYGQEEIRAACDRVTSASFREMPDNAVGWWTDFIESTVKSMRAERKGKVSFRTVEDDAVGAGRLAAAEAKKPGK